ncbi:MAG: hypothetical protein J6J24_00540 [Clostridia bacterium]|nr:hypothetical protein [Clostridia bacterium]
MRECFISNLDDEDELQIKSNLTHRYPFCKCPENDFTMQQMHFRREEQFGLVIKSRSFGTYIATDFDCVIVQGSSEVANVIREVVKDYLNDRFLEYREEFNENLDRKTEKERIL